MARTEIAGEDVAPPAPRDPAEAGLAALMGRYCAGETRAFHELYAALAPRILAARPADGQAGRDLQGDFAGRGARPAGDRQAQPGRDVFAAGGVQRDPVRRQMHGHRHVPRRRRPLPVQPVPGEHRLSRLHARRHGWLRSTYHGKWLSWCLVCTGLWSHFA